MRNWVEHHFSPMPTAHETSPLRGHPREITNLCGKPRAEKKGPAELCFHAFDLVDGSIDTDAIANGPAATTALIEHGLDDGMLMRGFARAKRDQQC